MLKIEKTFFHEILLKNHHFHADYLEIDYPGLVGQFWLKVNFSLQLDGNGRPVLTYGNRPKIDPSTVLNFDMDKLGKHPWTSLERAPLTSKTAKFESDLLKTNEDIASQRREILQTLAKGGGGGVGGKKTILSPYKTLYISTTLRSYILGVVGQQGCVRLPR